MCIICVSGRGVPQPTETQIKTMFQINPHGAGYMVARGGRVEIRKGFMTCDALLSALHWEQFTDADAVVYHFRIATQGGVTPAMCHPFPLTHNIKRCKTLKTVCRVGLAHNGIIRLTSGNDNEYSDTAHFIAEYMPHLLRSKQDLTDARVLDIIENLTFSKWAILQGDGTVSTIGYFFTETNGLLFSNLGFMGYRKLQNLGVKL